MGVSYCFMMTQGANGFAVLSSSLHTSFYFTALCFITRQPCRRAARQPCQTLSFPIRSLSEKSIALWNTKITNACWRISMYIVKMYSSNKNKPREYLYSIGLYWQLLIQVNILPKLLERTIRSDEVVFASTVCVWCCNPGNKWCVFITALWPFYLCPICSNPQPPEGNRTRSAHWQENHWRMTGVSWFSPSAR